MIADKFCDKEGVEKGAGGTVRWHKIIRPAKVTSTTAAGTLKGYADAKYLTSEKVEVSPSFFTDVFAIDDNVDIQAFFKNEDYMRAIANQQALSMDYQAMKLWSTQCFRHRIDKDTNYQKAVTATTANSAGTSLISTSLTEADDYWNGGYATGINAEGGVYDETSQISDFATTGDTATVSFANGITTSSRFRIVAPTGIVAGDKLSSTGLLDVAGLHQALQTERYSGGVFNGIIDSEQFRDVWDDTTFLNSVIYDSSEKLKNYQLYRFFDIMLHVSSQTYRESATDGSESTTGAVHVAPIFGANSHKIIPWAHGSGNYGTEWYLVDKPDSGNLTMGARWISWKSYWAGKVTRSTSVIGLMTGATSQAL